LSEALSAFQINAPAMLLNELPETPFLFAHTHGIGLTLFPFPGIGEAISQEKRKILGQIPGNTAKSHGRPFVTWLFLRFQAAVPAAARRKLLATFIKTCGEKKWHTSLLEQLEQWKRYDEEKRRLGLKRLPDDHPLATRDFGTVMLTGRTLDVLDPAKEKYVNLNAPSFWTGMPAKRYELGDIEKAAHLGEDDDPWKGYGFEEEFDLALLLARNTRATCDELVKRVTTEAARQQLDVAHREDGFRWQPAGPDTPTREPFGFVDGLSNLLFLKEDIAKQKKQGGKKWNPEAKWDRLLFLPGKNETSADVRALEGGSFVVLRKLEQNVKAFYEWEARQPAPNGDIPDAGSQLIGRARDGRPLVDPEAGGEKNEFNYEADLAGAKCPFFAHIRKANPRSSSMRQPGSFGTLQHGASPATQTTNEKKRLFVRRGTMYAPRSEYSSELRPGKTAPATRENGVGLLFTGYMSELEQFEFMHSAWLMNPRFPTENQVGWDPLAAQTWLTDPAPIDCFVTPRGGGYFFAPPIPWIAHIAKEILENEA
jgi:Dyp-type peroxidase family